MVVTCCAFPLTPCPQRAHVPTLDDRKDGQLLNLFQVRESQAGVSDGVAASRCAWLTGAGGGSSPPSGEESQETQGAKRALSVIQQTGAAGQKIQDHWPQTCFQGGSSWMLSSCFLSKMSCRQLLVI